MSYSYSVSNNPSIQSKTYGINQTTKTTAGNSINTKSGLTLESKSDGPFQSKSATLQVAQITYSSKDENFSARISSAKVSGSAGVAIGGGVGLSGKASLVEIGSSHTFKIGKMEVKISGEIGVGFAVGAKVGVANNKVSIGGKTLVTKGVYVGANIDIKF